MGKKWIIGICAAAAALLAGGITLALVLRPAGPFEGTVLKAGANTPLSGVRVSDGRNVVQTDAAGKFTLKGYRRSRFITVTVPAGYSTDQFYIPISKETKAYDFTLEKSEATAAQQHSFLHISDTEIGKDGVGAWAEYLKTLIAQTKPAFLMHTGDICYEDGLKRHLSDMNTRNMGCTVRYSIGNHDYVKGKYGEELYESIYGPVWYSFDVGNVHYVVTPFQTGGDYKSGYNKDDRWRWLENDLAQTEPEKKVVIFNHTTAPSDDYVISFDRKELDLKKHNLIAWVYGHYHYNYVNALNGVLNISTGRPDCGGIDSSASAARLVTIDGNGTVTAKMYYYQDISNSPAPKEALWSTQLDAGVQYCDTLVEGNMVFAATGDDNFPRKCGVYGLDAQSGKKAWFFETKNSVKNKLACGNGRLYAQDMEGNVYCLEAATGKLLWEKQVDLRGSLGTSSGICLDGDSLYAGCAANVTALNAKTGEALWNQPRKKGENSPAEFVVTGNKLIVSSHWDALVALDKTTGQQLWEIKDEDIRFRSSTPAVVDANTLLVADDDSVMLVDANAGKILNKSTFENYKFSSSGQPLVADGVAYIPTANKGLIAFDLGKHTILWETAVGGAIVFTAPYTNLGSQTVESTPVLSGTSIVFGASDGVVYTVNRTDGKVLKKQTAGAPVLGSAAFREGKVIVSDFAGRVTMFQ